MTAVGRPSIFECSFYVVALPNAHIYRLYGGREPNRNDVLWWQNKKELEDENVVEVKSENGNA